MITVNDIPQPKAIVELDFAWSPFALRPIVGPNGTILAPNCAAGVTLTYTAATKIVQDTFGYLTFVEYRWDFGDGIVGYGNPIQHSYVIPNFNATTTLQVLDSYGNRWYARHQMYIAPPSTGQASLPLLFTR